MTTIRYWDTDYRRSLTVFSLFVNMPLLLYSPNKKPSTNWIHTNTRIKDGKFVICMTKDLGMPTIRVFVPGCFVAAFVDGYTISPLTEFASDLYR